MSNNRKNDPPASLNDSLALNEHANAIRKLGKQTVENVIEIGRHLVEAKAEVKKRGDSWSDWLEREFNWSDQQARRFIHVFGHKSELNKLLNSNFPVSALYLLAAPSTPSEAREAIIERAQAGEMIPVAEVKRTIERTKGRKQPSSKPRKAGKRTPVGPNGPAEAERLRVRVEELQAQVRQRDITIEGLRRDIVELQKTSGDPMSVSEFQTAIKKREDTVETQKAIIARLENENAKLRAKLEAAPGLVNAPSPVTAGDPGPIPEFPQRKPAAGASDSNGDVTLRDAAANAFGEIEDLACDCRGQVDNAPAGLDQSARIQILTETADVLESLSMPDVPAELDGIKVKLPKPRRLRSRGDRRDAALGIISACAEALDAIDENDPRHEKASDFCSELQSASSELEGCEFS